MKCEKCQTENPEENKFCRECGAKLLMTCPQCAAELVPGDKFCGKCGHNLSLPSEPLSERLGPEEAYSIMDQVYEILIHKVHDYEGTVNEMTGDGIMALFGAPIALEDAPQRAIRSSLAIHREMVRLSDQLKQERGVPPIKMRIGVHTGPVVVGTLGNDLRVEFKAVGETVNLASRMEGLAEPGATYVTEETFKLTEGLFRFEALGKHEVKGKAGAVKTYRVIAPSTRRTRFDVSAERGLTPFVGRERELELLLDGFERSKGGRGQAFSIMAEAGVGKSRLLYEFRKAMGNEDVTFLEGRCLSYSRGVAYHPVTDILKSNFDLREGDGDFEIREKVTRGLKILGTDEDTTLPYLLELLSVKDSGIDKIPMSPEARKYHILEALKRIVLNGSEIRPLIMAFEDLHWVDKSSEESLKDLLDSISGARVFLIFTYRPEFVHTWGGKSYHSQVNLTRLSNRESLTMVSHLLGTGELDKDLEQLVLEKTEGVPFFIEELISSLKDQRIIERKDNKYHLARDIRDVTIPSTIQDVIMARVDSLPEGAKGLLQTGSVAGREFSHNLIKRVTDLSEEELLSHLSVLKDSELLYERGIYPQSIHIFKHALTQEVAYNGLLHKRRREIHEKIGKAIEQIYADRLAEQYEVLAYHFAKGEEWPKALEYLCKAAEKAAQAFATREAVALYDQALDAAGHLGDAADLQTLMAIHQAKMNLHFVLSDFESSRAEGERLLALARRVGDRVSEGSALAGMAWASTYTYDFDQALADAHQAIEIGEEVAATPVLTRGHFTAGYVYAVLARLDQARTEIEQALTMSQSGADVFSQSAALSFTGLLKNWEGKYAEASRFLAESLRIAREQNLVMPLINGSQRYGLTLTGKGDYDEALAVFDEGLEFSEKVGEEAFHLRLLNGLGWFYSELGDLDRALDLNRRSAEGGRKRGDPETIANAEINLGDVFLVQGDLAMAQELLDGVYRLANDPATSDWMKWRYSMHLFASYGELWLARGDIAKAQKFTDQCLEIATHTDSRKYLVKGWRLKGEIAFARRQWDESEVALRKALTIAQAIGNPTQLWKTHFAIGRNYTERKRQKQARQSYEAARKVIDQIKASLQNPGLRASLESSSLIQQVYDLSESH